MGRILHSGKVLHPRSIPYKLTMMFFAILLPLVGVSLFANDYSQRLLSEQITERTRGALLTTLAYVEEMTKSMDQQTLLIGSNPKLVEVWNDVIDPLSRENLFDMYEVQRQLSALTNVNGAVKEAFILHGESGNGISTVSGGLKWPGVREEDWFRGTIEAGGGLVLHVPSRADDAGAVSVRLNPDRLYYARLLDVFGNSAEPNVMVLAVDKSSLLDIVRHLQTSPGTGISLYYGGKTVLETSHEASAGPTFSIREDGAIWSIMLEQPEAELFEGPSRLRLLTVIIIAISALLAIGIALLVYREILKPLKAMLNAIRQFSGGNLTAQIVHRRKDEFGYLMNAFNRMADEQRRLIEEDYEKELLLARSKFSLLQSQINPHFLYNTLDMIYSVAIKHRIGTISEMVLNLARFFRVSLGKGRESFTLEETVGHLMYYLRVQQLRMDRFTVEIELAEETKQLPVLKLLLQPVVENAIVHGISEAAEDGELFIRSRLRDGVLMIEIEDTGVGMGQQELEKLRQALGIITSKSYRQSQELHVGPYFGLKNVLSRLKLYYGDEAELRIDSEYGVGTTVTLMLPVKKEEME